MNAIESYSRSLVKALSWRLWGTIDTILISLLVYGDLRASLLIGGLELFTKLFLYYIHERCWVILARSKAWFKEQFFMKSLSWRLFGTMDTIVISYFITGVSKVAFIIGGIELITKVILYYLHELAWSKVRWGVKRPG